ncbi:MAG: hypothetical protein IK124_01825 [Prevotella sp.]|nr:hypothetical protein [Prevotella sp.]MBR6945319.1 hypothetical protein [Prevotella sp.]
MTLKASTLSSRRSRPAENVETTNMHAGGVPHVSDGQPFQGWMIVTTPCP